MLLTFNTNFVMFTYSTLYQNILKLKKDYRTLTSKVKILKFEDYLYDSFLLVIDIQWPQNILLSFKINYNWWDMDLRLLFVSVLVSLRVRSITCKWEIWISYELWVDSVTDKYDYACKIFFKLCNRFFNYSFNRVLTDLYLTSAKTN